METKVTIDPKSEAAKVVTDVVKQMAQSQDAFRAQVQSGQAKPKANPVAKPV